ncbi:MAG: M23 family metallopeptidase [Streptosporangiaceae bacterium]
MLARLLAGRVAGAVLRLRTVFALATAAVLVVASFTGPRWLTWAAMAGFAVALVLLFAPATPADTRRAPMSVQPPVRGRWTALNSPASRTPSHGTHAYGQTYAIDLVHEPDPARPRVALTRWPLARRPRTFPGFGQPVLAPADGVVVRVSDWQRDHWSRTSWPAVIYLMLVEGLVREATGPGRVVGNHVVLDLGDGVYALLAHLRRRSALVSKGDRVRAGQPLAACGNSGNSSEPHLHFQLMDRAGVLLAAGLPFTFPAGVPATGQVLAAGSADAAPALVTSAD